MTIVSSADSHCHVAASSPRELNLVAFDICPLCLGVNSFDFVAVGEVPAASSLRLVKSELTLEVGAIRVEPLSSDQLTVFEFSNIFFTRLEENVRALSVFLSVFPVTRVDIFIQVGHYTFSAPLSVLPVAVVLTYFRVHLFADAVLAVVNPSALVLNWFLLGTLRGVSIVTLSMAFLFFENSFSYAESGSFKIKKLTPSTKSPV